MVGTAAWIAESSPAMTVWKTCVLFRLGRSGSHCCRAGFDCLDNVHIAGAAAEDCRDRVADLILGRVRIDFQVIERGDQHPRRAKPALQCMVLVKGPLERVELVAIGEALDRPQ